MIIANNPSPHNKKPISRNRIYCYFLGFIGIPCDSVSVFLAPCTLAGRSCFICGPCLRAVAVKKPCFAGHDPLAGLAICDLRAFAVKGTRAQKDGGPLARRSLTVGYADADNVPRDLLPLPRLDPHHANSLNQ